LRYLPYDFKHFQITFCFFVLFWEFDFVLMLDKLPFQKGNFFRKNPLNMVIKCFASITYDLTTWCFQVARHGAIHKHLMPPGEASSFAPNTVFLKASITDRKSGLV